MKIYDANDIEILDIEVDDDSYSYESMMGENSLILKFALPYFVEIAVGCYCEFNGVTYTLLDPQKFKVQSSRNYEYTITFEPPSANCKKYFFADTTSQDKREFSYTATPADFLAMFVANMNRRESGWTVGECIESDEMTETFNYTNCLDALTKIAEKFSTEWEIDNKTVHLRKIEYNKDTPLVLSYGQGGGILPGCGRENYSTDKPVEILFVIGSDRNIDSSTYGSTELHLPIDGELGYDGTYFSDEDGYDSENGRMYKVSDEGLSVIRADKDLITNVESSTDLSDDIYPKRVGVVSAVETEEGTDEDGEAFTYYDVIDNSIPESLNYEDCLIAGSTMTIVFQTGELAGRELEVEYVHDERRFKIVPAEIDGYQMPSGVLIPSVGDKYAIFGCMLPDSYINDSATKTGAEWDLFRAAIKVKYANEDQLYTFTGTLDNIWSTKNWLEIGGKIKVGGYVDFTSDSFIDGGSVLIRITGIKRYVNKPKKPIIELSNKANSGSFKSSVLEKISEQESVIINNDKKITNYLKMSYRQIKIAMSALQDDMLDGFTEGISPLTIQSMIGIFGSTQLQFVFVDKKTTGQSTISLYPDYNKTSKVLTLPASIVKHCTLGISTLSSTHAASEYKYWDVEAYESPALDDTVLYRLYIKASKSDSTAIFILSEDVIDMEEVDGYYHFLMGYLVQAYDGERSWIRLYGYTAAGPGWITTDIIQDPNANTVLDLVTGGLQCKKLTILAGSGYENLSDKPDLSLYVTDDRYESNLTILNNQISSKVSQTSFDSLTSRVSTAESNIVQNANNIALKVSTTDYNGNTIASLINLDATTATIKASKINLVGAVTFDMLATDAQGAINGAQNTATTAQNSINNLSNSLGGMAYQNLVSLAKLDSTIIEGGYIKTSLLDVDNLVVHNTANFGIYTASDYFINGFGTTENNNGTSVACTISISPFSVTATDEVTVISMSATSQRFFVWKKDTLFPVSPLGVYLDMVAADFCSTTSERYMAMRLFHSPNDASWVYRTTLVMSNMPTLNDITLGMPTTCNPQSTTENYAVRWDARTGCFYIA